MTAVYRIFYENTYYLSLKSVFSKTEVSIYEPFGKSFSYSAVKGKLARTYDIHHTAHYQIHESQLFRGKRVIAMDY